MPNTPPEEELPYMRMDREGVIDALMRTFEHIDKTPERPEGFLLVILYEEPNKPIEDYVRDYIGEGAILQAARARIAELEAEVALLREAAPADR